MSGIILAATGHRPDKLGGYDNQLAQTALVRVAMDELRELRPSWVLSGMALGFDQAIAQAAIELQIPFAAIIPCAGQEGRWPGVAQDYYQRLRSRAGLQLELHAGSQCLACELLDASARALERLERRDGELRALRSTGRASDSQLLVSLDRDA